MWGDQVSVIMYGYSYRFFLHTPSKWGFLMKPKYSLNADLGGFFQSSHPKQGFHKRTPKYCTHSVDEYS